MDRIINVKVLGSYIRKDNKVAGVQGEGNSTVMRIVFDESWNGFAKTLFFWNSRGENNVEIVLTTDLLTDISTSLLDYSVPIPYEALEYGGEIQFVIEGYQNGERVKSARDVLSVKFSPTAGTPKVPAPSEIEQLQVQIDAMLGDMQSERLQAEEAKNTAVNAAEEATASATKAQESEESAVESASKATNAAKIAVEAQENIEANANRAEEAANTAVQASESASSSANSASQVASSAATSASSAATSASNASVSETAAKEAQSAAEKARDEAQSIVGGNFVSKEGLDDALADYLPLSGGTMSGNLKVSEASNASQYALLGSNSLMFNQNELSVGLYAPIRGNKRFLQLYSDYALISANDSRIMDVLDPEDSSDAANKSYVDTSIATRSTATNLVNGTGTGAVKTVGAIEASGNYAFAEGNKTTASAYYSHAEGSFTTASGGSSHAEGIETTANGTASHAEGYATTANGLNQHVQGTFNIADTTSAHIVGNGTSEAFSNAHTLDWNGNAWFAGDVYVGSTSGTNKDDGSKKLATIEDIETAIGNKSYESMPFEYNENATTIASFLLLQPAPFDGVITKINFRQDTPDTAVPQITVFEWDGETLNKEAFVVIERFSVTPVSSVAECSIPIKEGQYIGVTVGAGTVCRWYSGADGAGFVYTPEADSGIKRYDGKYITLSYEMQGYGIEDKIEELQDQTDALTKEVEELKETSAGLENINVYDGISANPTSTGGADYAVYRLHTLIPAGRKLKITFNIVADCTYHFHYIDTDGNVLYASEVEMTAGKNVVVPDFAPEVDYYVALSAEKSKLYYKGSGTMLYQYYSGQTAYWAVGDTVSVKTPTTYGEFAVKMEIILGSVTEEITDIINRLDINDDRIDNLEEQVERKNGAAQLEGKIVFLAGDSRSSTDYDFYKTTLEAKCGCTALVQGASGQAAAYIASDAYFERLTANPHDFSIWIVGGNDKGSASTIGTFSADSANGQNGEEVVTETDITADYAGTCFIQAIDHMMRKYKALFYDFKTLNNGHMPKMIFCTDLPQQRASATSEWSLKENWERKRNAILECAEKNNVACLDLYKRCNFDMSFEPYWVSPTDKVNDNGLYFMDGLHPNQYGIDIITSLEIQEMLKYVTINTYTASEETTE